MAPERQALIERLAKDFTYHPSDEKDVARHERIRDDGLMCAKSMISQCPDSTELSLALSHLDAAVMWANQAIAKNS